MKIFSAKTCPVPMVVASLYLVPCAFAQGSWTFVPSMPTARWTLAATTGLDGTIYAIGGMNNIRLNTVEAYDPTTMTWSRRASMPTARSNVASAVGNDNGLVYALGGDSGTSVLDTVEAYDSSKDTWSTVAPMPTRRYSPAAVTGFDGNIYAMGGFQRDDKGQLHALNTVEAYDPSTDTWSNRSPMPTARASLAAALGSDGRIYAIGGVDYDRDIFLTEVQAYDPDTDTWTIVAPLRLGRYNLAAATGIDGRIYAAGGFASSYFYTNAVEVYDPATDQWTYAPAMNAPREALGLASGFDGRIYAMGGLSVSFDGKGFIYQILNSVEAYAP